MNPISRRNLQESESSDTDSEWSPHMESTSRSSKRTTPRPRQRARPQQQDNGDPLSLLFSTDGSTNDTASSDSGESTDDILNLSHIAMPEDALPVLPSAKLARADPPSTSSADDGGSEDASENPIEHTLSEYVGDASAPASAHLASKAGSTETRDGSPNAPRSKSAATRSRRGSMSACHKKSSSTYLPTYIQSARLLSWANVPRSPDTRPHSTRAMYPLGFNSTVYMFFDGVPMVALRTIFSALSPLPIGIASFHTLYGTARENIKYNSKYFDITAGGVYIFHGIGAAKLFNVKTKSRRVFPKLPHLVSAPAFDSSVTPPAVDERSHAVHKDKSADDDASAGHRTQRRSRTGKSKERSTNMSKCGPRDNHKSVGEATLGNERESDGDGNVESNGRRSHDEDTTATVDAQAVGENSAESEGTPSTPAAGTPPHAQHTAARKRKRHERNNDAFLMVPEISVGSQYYVCCVDKRCICRCHRREHPVSFAALRTLRICPKFHDGMTYYVYGFGRFRVLRRDGFSRNYQNATCIIASIDGHLAIFQNTLLSTVKFFHEMTPAELSRFNRDEIVYDYRDQDPSVLADLERRGFDLATVATECRPMRPPVLSKKFKRWLGNFDAKDTAAYEQLKERPETLCPTTLNVVMTCSSDLQLFTPPSCLFPPFSLARPLRTELGEFPKSKFVEYPPLAHHLVLNKKKQHGDAHTLAATGAAPEEQQSEWMRAHLHRKALASAERERDLQLLRNFRSGDIGGALARLSHQDFIRLLHYQCKAQFSQLHERLARQVEALRQTLSPQQIAALQLLLARVARLSN